MNVYTKYKTVKISEEYIFDLYCKGIKLSEINQTRLPTMSFYGGRLEEISFLELEEWLREQKVYCWVIPNNDCETFLVKATYYKDGIFNENPNTDNVYDSYQVAYQQSIFWGMETYMNYGKK